MQALILGCGYVGTAFGRALVASGHRVHGTCRSQPSADQLKTQGIVPHIFDGTQTADLKQAARAADIILASIPPKEDGDVSYLALESILNARCPSWIGYLSTTGVYGDRQGGWAFEDDVPTPLSLEAKRRVAAERAWRSLPTPAHIFRLPGIYGPGRSALDQVKAGRARRIDRVGQVFSRAHRDDIVSALMASIATPNPGRIYNICDDLPCASGAVVVEACRLLGVTAPLLVPFLEAGLSDMGQRFYSECKRVANARAKAELNWRPQFPTFVDGLADCFHVDERVPLRDLADKPPL
jgi:nucleoside-diphosphate-sugar epimerase